MDNSAVNNWLGGSGLLATIFGLLYALYRLINHSRLKSDCCGKRMVVSVDVDKTTPPTSEREMKDLKTYQPPVVVPQRLPTSINGTTVSGGTAVEKV
jgi:hypothetical protein